MDMTKKLTKDLIEMYWERKCLWQVNSKEYKKRDMKKKAYQEIVMFLRRNGVKEANAKLVREKIQNLRRAMRKEKKRIDSSGGNYSPTLWYYDLLIFVNDQYEDTASISNSSKIGDEKYSDIFCTDTEEDLFSGDDEKIIKEERSTQKALHKVLIKEENKEQGKKLIEEISTETLNTSEFEA
ncbi:uncharacterized protein LOC128670996 isoform X2 [Plodia interpunctella]|nr:uncharacterized protein LOC128670996 isoform X2 [Plodia interpunctella]